MYNTFECALLSKYFQKLQCITLLIMGPFDFPFISYFLKKRTLYKLLVECIFVIH